MGIVEQYANAWIKEEKVDDEKQKELVIKFAKKIEEMMELKDEKK